MCPNETKAIQVSQSPASRHFPTLYQIQIFSPSCQFIFPNNSLPLGLLLYIRLGTPLLRLADVVSVLSGSLGLAVASNARDGAPDSTSDPVGDTTGEVVDLALRFLALAGGVLLLTFTFQ